MIWLVAAAWAGTVVPGDRGGDPRPVLSGPEVTIDSADGFFRVHYTVEGADRPDGDYVDGVPAAATEALAALVASRDHYLARGWRPLVGDGGAGGSAAIDLYLQTVDINGYAHGVPVAGETARGTCWIEVDGALGGTGDVFASVVAHELHHCVQYRYTWQADSWIYEAGATYEQYLWDGDGALAVAVAFLWTERLAHPEWPLDTWSGRFAYAGMSFVKFWEDFESGTAPRGPALWEALEADPDWPVAFDAAAQAAWGLSFDDAFLEYATWAGFACARDDGTRWADDGARCRANYTVPVEAIDGAFEVAHDEVPYTSTYAEIAAGGSTDAVRVDCEAPGPGERLGVRLVAVDDDGAGGEEVSAWADAGEPLTVALSEALHPEGSALVVLASTGAAPVDTACIATRVPSAPDDPADDPGGPPGCACSSSGTAGFALWLPLIALFRRRNPTRRSETPFPSGSQLSGDVTARYRAGAEAV